LLRLGRGAQIILMSSICVILLLSLGWLYWQQFQEHRQVSQELLTMRTILAKPYTPPQAELEARLAHGEAELAALRSPFPNPRQSLEISQALFDLAKACQVNLLSLSVSLAAPGKGGAEQPTFSLDLSLEGKVSHLLDFMTELGEVLPTAEVVSTNMILTEGERAGLKLQVHTR